MTAVLYCLFHPVQFWYIIQWKIRQEPFYLRNPAAESPKLRECFRYLDMTSRSFTIVIQQLNHELRVPIALFYLCLRGLDTLEDDMALSLEKKVPLLRNFCDIIEREDWRFRESQEKDKELLEHFDVVIAELKKIKRPYFDIIKDTTRKMGNGMADYAETRDVKTIDEYELYCHHVAGVVGEGLTRIFVMSKVASSQLTSNPSLAESMGQFLQKNNIIRDIRQDWEEGRRWYPKEVWCRHVDQWEDLFDESYRAKAMDCVSEMILDALKHVEECLIYMASIENQSVFNFLAIPQGMAIATLELLFRNPDVLKGNVKVTKGDACRIMIECTKDIAAVSGVFKTYIRRIKKKNDPKDPSFFRIKARCVQIEQFVETRSFRQDTNEQDLKETSEATSKAAVWFLIVTTGLLGISTLVIGIAFVSRARLGQRFKEAGIFLTACGEFLQSLVAGRDEL